MDIINLENFLKNKGEKNYRLKQIKKAVFVDLIDDWDEAATLSKELREEIKKEFPISSVEMLSLLESKNKDSTKAVFKLKDGNIIETVLMRRLNTKEDDAKAGRNTVCVSSQAGCAMNCGFCATGKMGLKKNLTSEEIVDQVLFFARHLNKENQTINNITDKLNEKNIKLNLIAQGDTESILLVDENKYIDKLDLALKIKVKGRLEQLKEYKRQQRVPSRHLSPS